MQTWTDTIRAYAPSNLILVGCPDWDQNIAPAADHPLTGTNLAMVSHVYPAHWNNPTPQAYMAKVEHCLTRYPVFMSEW